MYINPGVNDLHRKLHKEEMKNAFEKNAHLVDVKISIFFLNIETLLRTDVNTSLQNEK